MALCLLCENLDIPWRPFRFVEMFREAGEKGCRMCRMITAGIDKMEDVHGCSDPLTMATSYYVRVKQLKGCTVLIETKDNVCKRVYELELYAPKGCDAAKIFGQGSAVPPYASLSRITSLAGKWIAECEANHEVCRNGLDPILPRRALDVGRYEETGYIYLLETCGIPGAYITLSHCWDTHQPINTTNESLARFMSGIALQSLPKTFRDAVIITSGLGLRYLWIDSLCILQDSREDWEEQSSQMAAIYSNSYLPLAASHAADSSVGFECQRQTSWVEGDEQESQSVESYEIPGSREVFGGAVFVRHSQVQAHADIMSAADTKKMRITPRSEDDAKVSERAPLLSRAWAFQERLLSPRTIHCHSGELMWDCKTGVACECNVLDTCNTTAYNLPKAGLSNIGRMPFVDVLALWYSYVRTYSKLKLTYSSDCLPALSGPASWISRRLSRLTNDGQYFAGLWNVDFPRALLWQVDVEYITRSTSRRIPYQAPLGHGRVLLDLYFEILEVHCETDGRNVFGQVSSGYLVCRGALLSARLPKEKYSVDTLFIRNDVEDVKFAASHQFGPMWPDFDFWSSGPEQVDFDVPVYAFVITYEEERIQGLVLKKCGGASEDYMRLGTFDVIDFLPTEKKVKELIRTIRIL